MTSIVIPVAVTDLLEHELNNVMKRVVHDLGRKYEFDRKEAYDFLTDKYKMEIIPQEEERVRITKLKKPKKPPTNDECDEETDPVKEQAKRLIQSTRCMARVMKKCDYFQCARAWNSQFSQLCKTHETCLLHGRIDDGKDVLAPRCVARTLYKGIYGQCSRHWLAADSKLCEKHCNVMLKHGRIDDDGQIEKNVQKIKSFV